MVCRVAILSGFARVRRAHSSCCGGGASRGEDDCAAVSVGAREMLGVVGRLWRCVGKDGRGVGTIEGSPDGGQSNGGVLSMHVLAELRSDGNCCHDRVPNIHSFALPSPHTPACRRFPFTLTAAWPQYFLCHLPLVRFGLHRFFLSLSSVHTPSPLS